MNKKTIASLLIVGTLAVGGAVAYDDSVLTLEEAGMKSSVPTEKFISDYKFEPKDLTAYSDRQIEEVKSRAEFTKKETLVLEEVLKGKEISYDPSVISPAEFNQTAIDIAVKLGYKEYRGEGNLYKIIRELSK